MSLPVWECGLKLNQVFCLIRFLYVTPCMGVWIEILLRINHNWQRVVTPCIGVWIEIISLSFKCTVTLGHSLYGSVDWNLLIATPHGFVTGHSLYGSVDWNQLIVVSASVIACHSLYGSVDWNGFTCSCYNINDMSLPVWECGLKLRSGNLN